MSRDVQEDMDDIEIREGIGNLGWGKEILVVVVMSEEEPLRSDTRLPLESSPYMAGNFLHCKRAARAVNLCSRPSPAIYTPNVFQPPELEFDL